MGVLRSEASFLAFSRTDPSVYYVGGLDSQLVCGQCEAAGTVGLLSQTSTKSMSTCMDAG
jgi:hypothetical protein